MTKTPKLKIKTATSEWKQKAKSAHKCIVCNQDMIKVSSHIKYSCVPCCRSEFLVTKLYPNPNDNKPEEKLTEKTKP